MIRLNETWAVGVIVHPPQWTLCRRALWKGNEEWHGVSFCQHRETLLRAIREKVIFGADFYPGAHNLAVDGAVMARIGNFPAKCDGNIPEEMAS